MALSSATVYSRRRIDEENVVNDEISNTPAVSAVITSTVYRDSIVS